MFGNPFGTQGAERFCEQELPLILLMSGKELQRRFSHVFGLQTKGLSISFSSSLRANTWKEQMETQKQMGRHIFICLMNRKTVRFPAVPLPTKFEFKGSYPLWGAYRLIVCNIEQDGSASGVRFVQSKRARCPPIWTRGQATTSNHWGTLIPPCGWNSSPFPRQAAHSHHSRQRK